MQSHLAKTLALIALCPLIGVGAGLLSGDTYVGLSSAAAAGSTAVLGIPLHWLWLDYWAWGDDRNLKRSARS